MSWKVMMTRRTMPRLRGRCTRFMQTFSWDTKVVQCVLEMRRAALAAAAAARVFAGFLNAGEEGGCGGVL